MKYIEKKKSKFVSVAICVIVIILIIASLRLQMELNELRENAKELQDELDAARIEVERLEYQLERVDDEDYIKQLAKDKLGYNEPESEVYNSDIPEN